MADVQKLKLQRIEQSLDRISQFLVPCLPLANAHATDFITKNYWDTLIPAEIREELLALSAEQLRNLPCGVCTPVNETHDRLKSYLEKDEITCDTHDRADSYTCDSTNIQTRDNAFSYTQDSSKSGDLNKTKENKTYCHKKNNLCKQDLGICTGMPKRTDSQKEESQLPYQSIDDFLSEARSCTIESIGVSLSQEDLMRCMGSSKEEVFVGTYMNKKKSHEVEVMSNICATLAERLDCKLVVDFGSGKGYLGNHLNLQYQLPVLGIDAASTNTQSAEKRNTVLDKQWHSLARNKMLESEGKKLTKKEKKKLKQKEETRRQATNVETDFKAIKKEYSDVTDKNKEVKNDTEPVIKTESDETFEIESLLLSIEQTKTVPKEIKFVPCTTFIDKETSFMKLAKLHFPQLFPQHEITSSIKCCQEMLDMTNRHHDLTHTYDQCCNIPSIVEKCHIAHKDTCTIHESCPCSNKTTNNFGVENSFSSKTRADNSDKTRADNCDKNVHEGTVCTDTNSKFDIMLIGLHTCGDLASTSMEVFVHSDQLKVLCNVGCCYHLLNEKYLNKIQIEDTGTNRNGFPLSRFLNQRQFQLGNTARNLASQSLHRISDFNKLQGERFFPRALLEVLIQDVCGGNIEMKGLRKLEQKCKSTQEYLRRACDTLGIADKVSDEMIEDYLRRYIDDQHRLAAFFQLKTVLAPCIEALIILDRVCFLLEQEQVEDVFLVKMFDPVKSPRCYGIVATKKTSVSVASP